MKHRERILALLIVLLAIGGAKAGQQVWRWYAFADERTEIGRLEARLDTAGLGVITSHLRADSLRRAIEQIDRELGVGRGELERYERQSHGAGIPPSLEGRYRGDLARYNERVRERNALYEEWQSEVETNHAQVGRYNRLVDSLQTLTTRIGEPYYPIPSPAEIANRHGVAPPE